MKPFIVITGMHRSGTSFLARALNLAGVNLGGLESLTSNEWVSFADNLKGHWENEKFLKLNEKILQQNNGNWFEIPQEIKINSEIGKEISKHVDELVSHKSLACGFKDPRTILTFDSCKNSFPNNTIFVGIFRHPLKVAESLKKRDGFEYEKSLELWKAYNEKLLNLIEENNGFLLNFDLSKEKLIEQLEIIIDKLGLLKTPILSEWYSSDLMHSDKNFEKSFELPDDILKLYSKLQDRTSKNITIPHISTMNEKSEFVLQLINQMNDQGKYFKKINEENKNKISSLSTTNKQQEESLNKLNKEKVEFKSNLKIAHSLINSKNHENNALKNEAYQIQSSVSWGIMKKVQKFLTKLFPPKSSRGNFLALVIQYLKSCQVNGVRYATRMAFLYLKNRPPIENFQQLPTSSQPKSWETSHIFDGIKISKIKNEISSFSKKPKISILFPVYNVDEIWLRLAIDSVRNQIYENWELCIVDDASTKSHIKPVLEEYQKNDSRIKVKFLSENKNIAGSSNEALSLATGDFVGLLDHDDELYQNSIFEVVKAINNNPNLEIIYSDENHISPAGQRIDPFFKPDYSPDLLLACHYMVHFIVYSKELLEKLNGFRSGFDGAQDYDLVLRAVENTKNIHHIPKLLYGWRNISTSTAAGGNAKPYAQIAAKKALTEALERRKINGTPEFIEDVGYYKINYNLTKHPLVSIIITTRDSPHLLSRLISSIEKKTTYENYEIIVVDHLNEKKEAVDYLKSLKHKVIRYEKEFNISNLFNFVESHANGEYLLTMNDDLEVITENWIELMLGPCQRDEVGIVGAQLIYPDASSKTGLIKGETIQHGGAVLGVGGVAGHAFRHVSHVDNGYFALNKTLRNYNAVTGACMLIKRDVYKKVNGYDPSLKVALNDIDFCLRVRKEGYLVVYTPFAKLYHYEGGSRGAEQPSENIQIFVNKWKNELIKPDPYYNVNLTLLRENFGFSLSGIVEEKTPLNLLLEIYFQTPKLMQKFPEVNEGDYSNLIQWASDYSNVKTLDASHNYVLSLFNFWYKENST